jgi:uncharacterized protein YjiS (DUF1127 family)
MAVSPFCSPENRLGCAVRHAPALPNEGRLAGNCNRRSHAHFEHECNVLPCAQRVSRWSEVQRYLVECVRRVRSRYELITLSERDLADMGMTRLDAFNESIKPFWEE